MKEIMAIVRKERVQEVVSALRAAGVPRLTLCHVHAVGSGVDPEGYRPSFEECTAYTEKMKTEVVCRADGRGSGSWTCGEAIGGRSVHWQ